LETDPAAPQ